MNAVISSSNIKAFSSALQCLARFSETFWLQAAPTPSSSSSSSGIPAEAQLRLSAINQTNSAFCMFVFDPDFFLRSALTSSSSSSTAHHRVECQLAIKPVLAILRTRARTVERCELDLVDDAQHCRFSIQLHCSHGVKKTHRVTYEPKKGLLPTADPNPPHHFSIHAQTAHEWTEHFLGTNRGGEISFWCSPDFCIVKSKEDEVPEVRGQMRKAIHTEVKIDLAELNDYRVDGEAHLTFSLREFKATVTLAEALQVPLDLCFSDGDEPLFIRLHADAMVAEFVLATSRGDAQPEQQQAQAQAQQRTQRAQQPDRSARSTQRMQQTAATQRATTTNGRGPQQQQRDSRGGNGAAPVSATGRTQPREDTSTASMPSASRVDRVASHGGAPMESTPHPALSPGSQRRADAPPPLFFPGASQDSVAEAAMHDGRDASTPHADTVSRGAGGYDDGEEANLGEYGNDLGDADFAALDEVERSIERGETQLIGSQLIVTGATSVSGGGGGGSRTSAEREGDGVSAPAPSTGSRHDSTDFPRTRPKRSAADRRMRLARIEEVQLGESSASASASTSQQGRGPDSPDRSSVGGRLGEREDADSDDDDDDDDDDEGDRPRGKRFKPLFG